MQLMPAKEKIGFGGGCHWCTEAVFSVLKGVHTVTQGFLSSTGEAISFSEGVLVEFDPSTLPLKDLIRIHLHTHSSNSDHPLRNKYRSAVYTFSEAQATKAEELLGELKAAMKGKVITMVVPLRKFRASPPAYQDYYAKDPQRPFCQKYIQPKLQELSESFPDQVSKEHMGQ